MVALATAASVWAGVAPAFTVMLGQTPWGSSVGLVFAAPSSWLVAGVYWAVVVAYLAPIWLPHADGPPARIALGWGLCGATCAGLLVNDLLARVVILDVVSVLVVLLLLMSSSPGRSRLAALWHYAMLRLGDMAFLLIALFLGGLAGTLSISTAFGLAAELGGVQRLLLIGAGLLAVWIKMGLAPATGWLCAASCLPAPERALLLSAGLPLLGAYLLLRLQPALTPTGSSAQVAWAIAGLLALPSLLEIVRPGQKPIVRWLTLHSVLAIVACLTQRLDLYVLTFVPLRMVICLAAREKAPHTDRLDASDPFGMPRGLRALAGAAAGIEALLENGVSALGRAPHQIGVRLQRVHSGKLRLNLLWPVLGLLIVLLALLITAPGRMP